MRNYYVYIYLDPRKHGKYIYGDYCFLYEPFYVGKGSNGRWKELSGRSEYFKNKINKIKKSRLEPLVVKLIENLYEKESFILEFKLINLIGRKGPLINFTDGGEGMSGWVPSKETKRKQSEKKKGENHPMFGKHHSEETRKKQSEKKKGKYPSDKTRKLMSEKKKGENHPMFGLRGINNPNYGKHRSEESKRKQSENHADVKGENGPNSILTNKKVIKVWKYLNEGVLNQTEISEKFGVSQLTISAIKTGKIWKHIQRSEK